MKKQNQNPSDEVLFLQLFGYKHSKGDEKKLEILHAAITTLAERGLEATTFEAIGEKIGIGRANVRYHFEAKEDLFLACVKYIAFTAQSLTVKRVGAETTAQGKLQAMVHGAYDWAEKFPEHISVWATFVYLATIRSEFRSLYSQIRQTGEERIGSFLAEQFKGALPSSKLAAAVSFLASAIQNIITGDLIDFATRPDPSRLSALRPATMRSVTLICQGFQHDL